MPLKLVSPRPTVLVVAATATAALLLACGCAAQRGSADPEVASTEAGDGMEPMVGLDEPAPAEGDDYGTPVFADGESPESGEAVAEEERRFRPFERLVADPIHYVDIAGPAVTGDNQVAIDVQNMAGVVKVIVDNRLDEATVWVRPYWPNAPRDAQPPRDVIAATDFGTAEHVADHPERSVLRVSGTPRSLGDGYPEPNLEIVVRTPAGDGLLIRNGSGVVDVLNTRGAITIENGVSGGEGGPVIVRTDHPIDAPVNIVTPRGDVLLVTVPESQGDVSLEAPEGTTLFRVPSGRVTNVRSSNETYSAIWNAGGNEIHLRSEQGDARLLGVTKPSMYTYNEFSLLDLDNDLKEQGFADMFHF